MLWIAGAGGGLPRQLTRVAVAVSDRSRLGAGAVSVAPRCVPYGSRVSWRVRDDGARFCCRGRMKSDHHRFAMTRGLCQFVGLSVCRQAIGRPTAATRAGSGVERAPAARTTHFIGQLSTVSTILAMRISPLYSRIETHKVSWSSRYWVAN
jgi:hypothetical protein